MKEKFRYLEQKERKKILLLCDDIRMHSGVATMAREMVVGTAHHFNWVNLGGAIKHPEAGKAFDLSAEINKHADITDSSIKLIPSNGYGDAITIRALIKQEKPDAILIFTDPRYWVWLFEIEREIRNKIPLFYLNIWDDYPSPLYNKSYYESCDLLMAISKQTKNINEIVLGETAKNKVITYVPHGINPKHFFPITPDKPEYEKLIGFKQNIFNGKDYKFIVFFNSRNIRRKNPGDVILAYRFFCDMIGKEKAKDCALIMHTQPVDDNGTDLYAVREALCDPDYVNVHFSKERIDTAQLNLLYNIADVNVLISSNEGWGLSLTEAMMTGTMIVGNVTGGMQDQMRFNDSEGNWINFSPEFPSNHRGTFKECGEWAVPVFPSNISVVGSVPTPYIFDDRCRPEDVGSALKKVFEMSPEERLQRGLAGREWALSDESRMSSDKMAQNIIESCDTAFENFIPRSSFDFLKIENRPTKYIKHKLLNY